MPPPQHLIVIILSLTLISPMPAVASTTTASAAQHFKEAPQFYNSPDCPSDAVHVAMTLDTSYIRGSMAAILSVLQHSSCPQNIAFHFIASAKADASLLHATVSTSFPYLKFRIYPFDDSSVSGLISTSIRSALDCPLNYARSYLANLLPLSVRRVVYLDSDLVLVDDIAKLAATDLGDSSVLAAPEYCDAANFTSYFTPSFWSNHALSLTFADRKACYFNTGVMVIDLGQMEGRRLHDEDRRMDGVAEEDENIRAGFVASVLVSLRR